MRVYQTTYVDMSELISEVQKELCTVPFGGMFPPVFTKDEVEGYFLSHCENYGASNGVYVPLYLEANEYDTPLQKAVKSTIRNLIPNVERILLHHSW